MGTVGRRRVLKAYAISKGVSRPISAERISIEVLPGVSIELDLVTNAGSAGVVRVSTAGQVAVSFAASDIIDLEVVPAAKATASRRRAEAARRASMRRVRGAT